MFDYYLFCPGLEYSAREIRILFDRRQFRQYRAKFEWLFACISVDESTSLQNIFRFQEKPKVNARIAANRESSNNFKRFGRMCPGPTAVQDVFRLQEILQVSVEIAVKRESSENNPPHPNCR
jgi:hypothetical protein